MHWEKSWFDHNVFSLNVTKCPLCLPCTLWCTLTQILQSGGGAADSHIVWNAISHNATQNLNVNTHLSLNQKWKVQSEAPCVLWHLMISVNTIQWCTMPSFCIILFDISMESCEETAVMIKQQSELSNDRVSITPPERLLLKPICGWGCRCFDSLNTVFIS